MELQQLIALARGEGEVDILLENASVVNVFTGEVEHGNVALSQGMIVGFGNYQAREVQDLDGCYLVPSFIDAHVHIESSMVGISEYARAVLPHGVTTVVTDFHELSNVLGIQGIELMRREAVSIPLNLYVMLPSCVPASPHEHGGARVTAEDIGRYIQEDWVLGVGEMMNFPGVLHGLTDVLDKVRAAQWKPVDGHAPGLGGKDLNAYLVAGITSDHECTDRTEAAEKLARGMYIMIREGSTARNLEELIRMVTPANSRRCMFVSDDRNPSDLISEGSIDFSVQKAIRLGLDPITAVQMATINPAHYFRLSRIGAVAPGYHADLCVLASLDPLHISRVFKDGRLIARDGKLVDGMWRVPSISFANTFRIGDITTGTFRIPARGTFAKVIEVVPGQIVTQKAVYHIAQDKGAAVADPARDILKVAVVERHKGTGKVGLGFVRGFGVRDGAIASSVAHDAHNIVVVATDDGDMAVAVRSVAAMGGGLVAVKNRKVAASLALPIAGLLSPEPIEQVKERLDNLHATARAMGAGLEDPFMALAFLALPVIPELKITDMGLVDVSRFEIVPLFEVD
jgi:adenine deaminase